MLTNLFIAVTFVGAAVAFAIVQVTWIKTRDRQRAVIRWAERQAEIAAEINPTL